MPDLTHIDNSGAARMVDVGGKPVTRRRAVAGCFVTVDESALQLVRENAIKKGDVLQAARLAGIMAAKQTAALIPLCHPLLLANVNVDCNVEDAGIRIRAEVECDGKTGVEMEALTAASVAALTIYDMCKAVDRAMVIAELCLLEKSGGRSGTYHREEST